MAFRLALFSRPTRTETPVRPSLTLFFWLVGAFLLTLLPHVDQLPVWVSLVVITAMAIRSVIEIYRLPLPSITLTSILAVCLFVGIYLQFQTILGRDAGTAFMAGLLAIKFYELRGPRDIAMIIFSSFFVVMSALLYSQALELFVYCLIMMWLLTATLLRTNMGDRQDNHLLSMLRLSGIIFVEALPLAVFFFFFLPRYNGRLQFTLSDAPLGLTDRVEPGSVARLANNDSPAMYVKFLSGDVPTTDTMYWRALVLWHYQLGAWTPGRLGVVPQSLPASARDSDAIIQEITIWPSNQKWLFALDYPVVHPVPVSSAEPATWSTALSGGVVALSAWGGKLDHRERYTVTSSLTLANEELKSNSMEYDDSIQLPDETREPMDPRVRSLADQLHHDNPDPQAYVFAVLHYFRHEHFVYTAAPGVGPKDWLPNFLFVKKAGFCEHYASAFAVLMRLEKVPTRLVIGYQGAEYNPYDGLYTVRQANAHAWDEVWIEAKKHWVRVDPTAVLPLGGTAPVGSNDSSKPEDTGESLTIQVAQHQLTFSEKHLPGWVQHAVIEMQLRRQQVEANWDDWVFSYDPESQIRLATALGLRRETLLLACLLASGACAILFHRMMKQRPVVSPVEDLYARFCRSMAQRGIPRAKWEGPLAYTERVAEAYPDKKEAIRDVGEIVARTRYGATPLAPATPKELQTLLTRITATQAVPSTP